MNRSNLEELELKGLIVYSLLIRPPEVVGVDLRFYPVIYSIFIVVSYVLNVSYIWGESA